LAFVVLIVPKVGAASDLAIKIPTPETQEWYLQSVNHSVDTLHEMLRKLRDEPDATIRLANLDLDTGDHVKLGDYPLTDRTYARLLERITSKPERGVPEDVKRNIIEFYDGKGSTPDTLAQVSGRLTTLRMMKATADPR
jgi:hypothetical protein